MDTFRKVAAAAWGRPNDPTVHGIAQYDMGNAMAFIERCRARGDCRVTVTHLVVRAMARAMALHPEANSVVRFRRIRQRKTVDVFLQVEVDGKDLSGTLLREVDKLTIFDVDRLVRRKVDKVRKRQDELFKRTLNLVDVTPVFILRRLLFLSDFIGNRLGWHLPKLGIPREPFGSCMVTSVGMLGIQCGLAPFFPLSICPMILCVGVVEDRPVVVDGEIVIRPCCTIGGTIDHRVVDGAHMGRIGKTFSEYLADPAKFEPDPETIPIETLDLDAGDGSGGGESGKSETPESLETPETPETWETPETSEMPET